MNSPFTIATRSATDLQDKVRKDIQVTPIPGDMKATEYVDHILEASCSGRWLYKRFKYNSMVQ